MSCPPPFGLGLGLSLKRMGTLGSDFLATVNNYFRPDGASAYNRPDGTSFYIRP